MSKPPPAALPVRIWNPVTLGGGVYRVLVLKWGDTFCCIRLAADVDGRDPARAQFARPFMARPEELHAVDTWEAEHGRVS